MTSPLKQILNSLGVSFPALEQTEQEQAEPSQAVKRKGREPKTERRRGIRKTFYHITALTKPFNDFRAVKIERGFKKDTDLITYFLGLLKNNDNKMILSQNENEPLNTKDTI